jgi:hypothetical protein
MKGAARANITPDCYIPTKRLFQELRSGRAGSIPRFIFDRGFRVTPVTRRRLGAGTGHRRVPAPLRRVRAYGLRSGTEFVSDLRLPRPPKMKDYSYFCRSIAPRQKKSSI